MELQLSEMIDVSVIFNIVAGRSLGKYDLYDKTQVVVSVEYEVNNICYSILQPFFFFLQFNIIFSIPDEAFKVGDHENLRIVNGKDFKHADCKI